MHPRERILGYIKYYQDKDQKIPTQVLREAHKWRIDVRAEVSKLADHKLKNERKSKYEQD